jgi:hypothetical protein
MKVTIGKLRNYQQFHFSYCHRRILIFLPTKINWVKILESCAIINSSILVIDFKTTKGYNTKHENIITSNARHG